MSAITVEPQVDVVKEKKKPVTEIVIQYEEKVDPYAYTSMYKNIVK